MPTKFKQWVRQHILPRRRDDTRFPSLPPRDRPVTPPSYAPSSATANSPFFAILPAEIRRQILIEAFGNSTLHIDLVYDHPPLPTHEGPASKNPTGGYYHCKRLVPRPGFRRHVDDTKPRRWQWFGSVCHSLIPDGSPLRKHYRREEPCLDACGGDAGEDPMCSLWAGETPAHCFVAALGWLRSCREAYAEGVEVLYATNTFRIRDMMILGRARELFVPHRWASVRKLEIVWCMHPWGDGAPGCDDLESYLAFLKKMPSMLAGLDALYVSVQGGMGPREEWPLPPMEGVVGYKEKIRRKGQVGIDLVLEPMEAMIRQLPEKVACSIAVPSSMYVLLRDEALREGRTVERTCLGQRERCWRETEGRGYWLRLGQVDMSSGRVLIIGMTGGWMDEDPAPEEDKVLYEEYDVA
jgi:hypothetical protein